MTPLHIFLATAQKLSVKPIDFWLPIDQKNTLKDLSAAVGKLKKILENKGLTDTHAYAQLKAMGNAITAVDLKEVVFVQALGNLADIYKHTPADEVTKQLVGQLCAAVIKAKPCVLEYHLSLESLSKKAKNMSLADQEKKDAETIQKVGVFYVLEYTLQVLDEFLHLSDADKVKLMREGLKTKAGNLPSYYSLEDTMRKELCSKIFDENLRHELFEIFYKFEEICYNGKMAEVGSALKKFNLAVLKAFYKKGLKVFKGIVYMPFGNNVPIEEIIKKVGQIKL